MATPLVVQQFSPSYGNERPGYYGPPTPGTETAPFPAPGVPTPTQTPSSGLPSSSAGPTPTKIQNSDIKSRILRPSLTSHYVCRFSPYTANGKLIAFLKQGESLFPGSDYEIRSNQDLIEISCGEASLPGSSLITNEINDDFTGVTERSAYRRQYDDRIDFTFLVDYDYRIINFFERWISYCVGENSQSNLNSREYFYRVNFPNDYQTDSLYITKFERDITTALEYKFIRAYPISITSMPVSYDSSQLLKCTVSFTYTRYVRRLFNIEEPQEPAPSTPPGIPKPQTSITPTPKSKSPLTLQQQIRIRRGLGLLPGQVNPGSGGIVPEFPE